MDHLPVMTMLAGGTAFCVYASASYAVLRQVNDVVREPYMDEIFHVPQAQRYCKRQFDTWDPKLTTPPGLYLISMLPTLAGSSAVCTTAYLRLANWVLGMLLFWATFGILRTLRPQLSASVTAMATLSVSLTPVVFFFHHLYYTDTGSLLFVLLAYLASLRSRHVLAAVLGFASLWFRQTNVIWVMFIGGSAVLRRIQLSSGICGAGDSLVGSIAQLARWMVRSGSNSQVRRQLVLLLAPYACVGTLFAAFVVVNQGIVLGDKVHHQAVLHVPQMLYFYVYAAGMLAPIVLVLSGPWWFVHALRSRSTIAQCLLACISMGICVKRYTIEHAFLLSDNRHYPFYVWKNVYRRHWAVKYLVVPAYVYAIAAIHRCTGTQGTKNPVWRLALVACTAAVLVPSPLLEFRYFTIPFVFARLHMSTATFSVRCLILETLWCSAINAATVWMFLNRPFTWDSEPGKDQRFMW
ncbi:glucosyltransferase [Coemansia sp. RSA 1646]|nr:glucosyltransferase [Coemansia sp. RSA 1646]